MKINAAAAILAAGLALGAAAAAQEMTPPSDTTRFVLDTALLVVAGLSALFFVLAFGLRDIGMAQSSNAPSVCLRMIGLLAVTALAFWLNGYTLMFSVEPGGLLGEFGDWRPSLEPGAEEGRSSEALWFYHMSLAAIPSAIMASAVSERIRLFAFLALTAGMAAIIYPIAASWSWGGGYFSANWRFLDFGGAATVHIIGGAGALAAAFVLGPRPGRFRHGIGRINSSEALPLAVFAAGLMLLGWCGALAGAIGGLSSAAQISMLGVITVKTMLSAASAVLVAIILTQIVYKRPGLVSAATAAIGGAVAISADPVHPTLWQTAMIGAIGGVIVTVTPPFLARYRIDDAGVVVPAHLFCGVWSIVIAAWSNPESSLVGQLVGAAAFTLWGFLLTLLISTALRFSVGMRLKSQQIEEIDESPVAAE